MIKKILCVTLMSCFAIAAFASNDSDAAQKQIAENCKSYLMSDTIPKNNGHADAALKACYDNNSCSNDALLSVKDCTKKLLNWETSYSLPKVSVPKVNDSTQKKATQKKTTTPAAETQHTTTPMPAPIKSKSTVNNADVAPVDLNNNTTTLPTNTPPKKKPSINWF